MFNLKSHLMRAIIIIIINLFVMSSCSAQSTSPKQTTGTAKQKETNVVKTADGNYTAKTTAGTKTATPPKASGKTYTDSKGKVYPVYQGAKGGLYIIRVSAKTGKEYKYYLQD